MKNSECLIYINFEINNSHAYNYIEIVSGTCHDLFAQMSTSK